MELIADVGITSGICILSTTAKSINSKFSLKKSNLYCFEVTLKKTTYSRTIIVKLKGNNIQEEKFYNLV